jgi:APA family basic amino acid/polyamine antiporter
MSTARTSPDGLGAQFAVSLIFVMFAYSGWNAANYVIEEMKTPEKTLPIALLFGTGLVAVLYVALNAAYLYALPLESLKGVVPVGATSAAALFGERYGDVFTGLIMVGLLSSISAMALVGPRVYYAMAQDGCFPLSAARVHPRWHTPVYAILYQAAASAVMVLTGTFEKLVFYIGFTLILCAAMAVAGLLRLRRRAGWRTLRVVSFCYPAIPLLFLVASAWMLAWTFIYHRQESVLGLLTVACGALVYHWRTRRANVSPEASRLN